jgi:hypothetical protein
MFRRFIEFLEKTSDKFYDIVVNLLKKIYNYLKKKYNEGKEFYYTHPACKSLDAFIAHLLKDWAENPIHMVVAIFELTVFFYGIYYIITQYFY